MRSVIEFLNHLPELSENSQNILLIYDSIFEKKSEVRGWLKKIPYKISVRSGEQLKTLGELDRTIQKISGLKISKSTELTFVALGGGTVCDFVGFLASVFLRGRKLILIPTTWLAAVDSAHGGKNGLNFRKIKNQIGTFYLPQKIIIVKTILRLQPNDRLVEAMGETLKVALINDKKLFFKLENPISFDEVYAILPKAIDNKYKVVKKDPLEKNGTRRLLNLGHTLGHVLESHFQISHGEAVLHGLEFSARWSFQRGLLSEADFIRILVSIENLHLKSPLKFYLKSISNLQIKNLLCRDKKITAQSRMDFIFIKSIGQCERNLVAIDEIVSEVVRQRKEK
jgi:3-dehydroquinate synthetase